MTTNYWNNIKNKVKNLGWLEYLYIEHYHLNSGYFAITFVLFGYLSTVLNLGKDWVSILLVIWSASNRFSRLFIVPLLHRLNTGTLLRTVCTIYCVGLIGLCLTDNPYFIALCLFIAGAANGTHSISTYSITSYASKHYNTGVMNYARLAAGSNYGNLVGPLVSNLLFQSYPRYGSFAFATFVVFSCQGILKFIPKDVPRVEKQEKLLPSIKWILSDRILRATYAVIVMSWFLYTPIFSAMPRYFSDVLHRPELSGFLVSFSAFVGILCTVPMTKLALKWSMNAKTIALSTFLVYLLGYLALLLPPNIGSALVCVTCQIIGLSLSGPVLTSIIGGRTKNELRSVGFVLNSAANGIGEVLGSFFASRLMMEQLSGTGFGSIVTVPMFMSFFAVIFFVAVYTMGHLFEEHAEECKVPDVPEVNEPSQDENTTATVSNQ